MQLKRYPLGVCGTYVTARSGLALRLAFTLPLVIQNQEFAENLHLAPFHDFCPLKLRQCPSGCPSDTECVRVILCLP